MKNNRTLFLIILASVVITGLSFTAYAFSKMKSFRAMRSSLEQTQSENIRIAGKETSATAGKGKIIPDKMWSAEFVEIVYAAAAGNNIKDITFDQKQGDQSAAQFRRQTRTQADSRETVRGYPVKVSFSSGYREMAEFIRELQGLDRLVTIDSLGVKRDRNRLIVEMTLSTYAMEGR